MAINKGVSVKILGKDYQVACPEDQTHHLVDAALLLDNRMKDIRSTGKVIGSERIAVMAALNLAHELLSYRAQTQQTQTEMEQSLHQMHDKLVTALS